MLVIKLKYKKWYKCRINVFADELGLDVGVVYIQEPFLKSRHTSNLGFNLYWSFGIDNWTDIQVLIVVGNDILNKVFIEN